MYIQVEFPKPFMLINWSISELKIYRNISPVFTQAENTKIIYMLV